MENGEMLECLLKNRPKSVHVQLHVLLLEVPQPHPHRRLRVEVGGDPIEPPQRHHLDDDAVGGEEEEVGRPGPVDARHHVARVPDTGEPADVEEVRLRDHHLEPHLLRHRHHLFQVHEPSRPPPRYEQQPRLPARRGVVSAQRVGAPRELEEVRDGVPALGGVGVDHQVSLRSQSEDDAREAMHTAVVVVVDHAAGRELP